ncbi:hypothetical protein FGE12_07560 [Aggregicoccus sp. 17bor-14]|uniref:hypothetical protein n=1 Tax=Myxococcaceae TaxID=31 RepID=UPI00129CE924|nr:MULTISPECIES: hypothetical protein [Myxococcaceae]MBF5042250.1 hypothetical protein [Simulacricoccus sp. 17bor-14]MRI88025.1 hypothetical protein [Aggregicoccus sp. 17bor-14]
MSFAFGVVLTGFLLFGLSLMGVAYAVAAVVCFRRRHRVAVALLAVPSLCALTFAVSIVVRFVREMTPDTGIDDPARVSRAVSAQDLVGSWGEGREAVTFQGDGTARTADGALWRWKQRYRNAFVMSLVGAEPARERCWIGLRQGDDMLLFSVDSCFDEAKGWALGAALRRND